MGSRTLWAFLVFLTPATTLTPFIEGVVLIAFGEIISVLLAIESNTRKG
jgi:hypothetical protein